MSNDWYVSSAAYATYTAFQTSHAYSLGALVIPTAPVSKSKYVFRCTTAGTSSTEPNWGGSAGANNSTVTTGTATFTNVTGQSAFFWTAASGDLQGILGYGGGASSRLSAGDRVFLSSDHSETIASPGAMGGTVSGGYTVLQYICVNRAGSTPPVAADVTTGAIITASSGTPLIDNICESYHYGITYATTASGGFINFGQNGFKSAYMSNCQLFLNNAGAGSRIACNDPTGLTLDNSTVQFGNTAQGISSGGYLFDIRWYNTPTAIAGATIPATLFLQTSAFQGTMQIVARGVDFSAITGSLFKNAGTNPGTKMLLDSCKIASGVTRYNVTNAAGTSDQMELVNCYDGTSILSEQYSQAGAITTEFTYTLSGGAADNVGAYSHKMSANGFVDKFVYPLNGFWMDVNYTTLGSAKTATVEIESLASLQTDEISLYLEYEGTASSSVATFGTSFIATPLTTPSAVTTSTATWNGGSTFANVFDQYFNPGVFTLTNGGLTATGSVVNTNLSTRSIFGVTSGKIYFEVTAVSAGGGAQVGIGNTLQSTSWPGSTFNGLSYTANGNVYRNSVVIAIISTYTTADVVCVAVDIANKKIWFRKNGGNWDNTTDNPATNTGGYDITTMLSDDGTVFAAVSQFSSTDSFTLNVGNTAFAQTAPSGFTAILATTSFVKQKLQVPFTPQTAGRLRGQLRLGKAVTAWYNPQITVT